MSNGLYVYAIVRNEDVPPQLDDAVSTHSLTLVPWHGLAAVARQTDVESSAPTMSAVRHHEAIVEALLEKGAALPVRYGTVFRDAASVAGALAEQYDSLAADLQRLANKAELSLTALWECSSAGDNPARQREEASTRQHAGALYLRARAAHLQREEATREKARAVAVKMDEKLDTLYLENRVQLVPTAGIAVRTAYLVERTSVADFRTAFEAMRRTQTDLRLLLTGPWPPYSFVTRTPVPNEREPSSHLGALARILETECGSAAAEWPRR